MPWGGDIFMYSETTTMAGLLTAHALRQVDLVVTGAVSSIPYLESRFRVKRARIHFSSSWGADLHQFRRAPPEERQQICEQFGIPPEALIVMNVRRFLPAWGSDVALESFLRFAASEPSAYFVLLGGAGTETLTTAARQRIRAEGHADRFVLVEGNQPITVCAKLMSVADIFVSLIRMRDMRSSSVVQAAAAGGAPIIGNQQEYRCMENEGFKALFVDEKDVDAVVRSLQEYAANPGLRSSMASANQAYLTMNADVEMGARDLIRRVDEICKGYRRR
jgi:glycosyltransferase involved in cell wall biosynthesis